MRDEFGWRFSEPLKPVDDVQRLVDSVKSLETLKAERESFLRRSDELMRLAQNNVNELSAKLRGRI